MRSTPPDEDASAGPQHLLAVARTIGPKTTDYQLVIDTSTVAVSTSDRIIVVGAPVDDDLGSASGSVQRFNVATGAFIRLNRQRLGGGARGDDDGAATGYVFDVITGAQLGKLVASDVVAPDILARAAALSGFGAMAGAAREPDRGSDSAPVRRFALPAPSGFTSGIWATGPRGREAPVSARQGR